MGTTLIACEMLEDEVQLALRTCGREMETVWVERRLHLSPQLLRERVQAIVAEQPAGATLLLAMAQCGNALVGLESCQTTLVLPRWADCLHLLLSREPQDAGELDCRTLYLTRGWLEGEKALLNEYQAFAAKHGEKKARAAYRRMVAGYRDVCMIDTGAYDLQAAEVRGRATAELLGLSYTGRPGSVRVLQKLLRGPWDAEFLVIPPGSTIREQDFYEDL